MPPTAASSNPGTSRMAVTKMQERLTKLSATSGIITKKKRTRNQQQQQPEITSQSTFFNKKENLEKSFSKINEDLAARTTEHLNIAEQDNCNVFMDILKIAPVIDLAEDERGSTSCKIIDLMGDEHIMEIAPLELGDHRENKQRKFDLLTKITKQIGKTNMQQQNIIIDEEESSLMNMSITSMSDIDLREKPIDMLKFQRKNMRRELRTNGKQLEIKVSESRSDLDLRPQIGILKLQGQQQSHIQQLPSTSSTTPLTSLEIGQDKTFKTRIRFVNRSPKIDLNMQYKLIGLRYFQEIKGKSLDHHGYQSIPLNIVSFNVLCQRSKEKVPHLYKHLHAPNRWVHGEWNSRYQKLMNEFDRLKADIFCLQEVQNDHYEKLFQPFFIERGYRGFFTPRDGVDIPDGCAIFWLASKLELLHTKSVIYNLGVVGMDRHNVGQIAVFGLIGQMTALCITNTHIYYNMKQGEVKLAQIAYLLSSMQQTENHFKSEHLDANESNKNSLRRGYKHFAGHVVCGDFNMEAASPLHRFILDGKIDIRANRHDLAYAPWSKECSQTQLQNSMNTWLGHLPKPKPLSLPIREMGISSNCAFTDKPMDLFDSRNGILTHGFKFASVYEYWNVIGDEEISTYHRDWSQPDFIFYTVFNQRDLILDKKLSAEDNLLLNVDQRELAHENNIQLRKRLSLPTWAQLDRACGPLPNEQYGSDHLSLNCVFDIICPIANK